MTLQQPIQLTQMPPDSTTRSGIRQRGAEREVRRLIQSLTAEEVEDVVAAVRVVVDTVLHQNLQMQCVKVHAALSIRVVKNDRNVL